MSKHVIYPNVFWCVENLTSNSKETGPVIPLLKCKWRLKITVYNCVGNDKVQIFLKREADPGYSVDTHFYVTTGLYGDDGTRHLEKSMEVRTTSTKLCTWEAFIGDFLKFDANGQCRVNIFMSFLPGKELRISEEKHEPGPFYNMSVLCQDFEKLLHNQIHADLALRCGGKLFPVHKSILSARSAKFKFLLQQLEREATSDNIQEIIVAGIGPDILKHMLRYVYLGEWPADSLPILREVIEAIQEYNIL